MDFREYDIIEPPTLGKLDELLSTKRLGQVTLPLVVRFRQDELTARRSGDDAPLTKVEFVVTQIHHDGTPFLLGYVGSHEVQARLGVINQDGVSDDDRTLEFVTTDAV